MPVKREKLDVPKVLVVQPPAAAPPAAEAPEPVQVPAKVPRKKRGIQGKIRDIWDSLKGKKVTTKPVPVKREKPAAPKPAKKEEPAADEPRVMTHRIIFSGNSIFDGETLNGVVGASMGQYFSLAELRALAEQVAQHYHDQGYFLTRVAIPQQDVKDGTVTFSVLEGRLGDLTVSGSKRYREKYIRRVFSVVKAGEPIRKQDLERALLTLNNSSGIEAKSVLQAGKTVGSTDLIIRVAEQSMAESSVSVNNFGSRSTGRYRITPWVTFPNLSGRGDEISMSAISAPDTSDLLYGNLTYMTPIDGKGRQIKAYVSGGRYEVGKEFDVLDIKGDGFSYGIGVTHPQVLSRSKSLTYDLWYEFKDSEHEMLGQTSSKDKISKVRLGASLDQKDRKGRSFVNFNVHQGLGDSLNGMPDKSTLSSRSFALADNRFTKYSLDFTRVEGVNPHIFHIARFSGQYSTKSLVSGEQRAIGGA
ncbi:MAG: ShlB/FhaC/HecB family hemolysin secretion/activation protein, partial [bacterium]|nr:ShlB/FhaC/HecB family hemolysin secretion/activation protein [bacterium]